MEDILIQFGMGILGGFFVAGSGYLKSMKGEYFTPKKFVKTIILGTIVGGIAGVTGLGPEAIIAFPAYAGITAVVENLLKIPFRR